MNIRRRIKGLYYNYLNRRYSRLWNHMAREDARTAILPTGNDSEFDSRGQEDANWLKSLIPTGSVVLDLGCGIGRIEKFLAPHCKEMHSVDISERMIEMASRRLSEHRNIHFHVLTDQDLSLFGDGYFDAVFSLLVLQHMQREDALRFLMEFNRVLKHNGLCILQFPNMEAGPYFDALLQFAGQRTEHRSIGRTRMYTKEEIEILMTKLQFRIESLDRNDTDFLVVARKCAPTYTVRSF